MANRFWVAGGNGLWSSTTNWSTTTGGASGASVPGAADQPVLDLNSGSGTSTLDYNTTNLSFYMTDFTGTLDFGIYTISVTGSGTVFQGSTTTTVLGTKTINVTNSGATATTIYLSGANTEANTLSFNFTAGTYALSFLTAFTTNVRNVDFTGFAGTWNARTNATTIYGSLTLSSGMTFAASSGALTFGATSGTQIITSNGKTFNGPITINGVGGTVQLADALTMSGRPINIIAGTFDGNSKTISGGTSITMATGPATIKGLSTTMIFTHTSGTLTQGADNSVGSYTFTAGTLNLASYKLTVTVFGSSNTNVRTINFGTGNITCNNIAGGTLWSTSTATGLTVTGTPTVNITNSGAVATTVIPGPLTEAQAISFNFTTGTYALAFLTVSAHAAKSVNFTGFAGTWNATQVATIYGNLTLSTGMTLTASVNGTTFGATSGTQVITSNAKTIDFAITVNGAGGTVQLFDNMTLGATRTLTFGYGTLDLNGNTLTTGLFASSTSSTRTIAFGTGNITCNAAGGTLWTTAVVTNLTVTGTPVVNISNSGAVATTVATGTLNEASAISFNFTTGTYSLSFLNNASYTAKNVNFTGFAGTWLGRTSACTIYGSLTLSSAAGFLMAASAGTLTLGATSGIQLLTSNGKTFDGPMTMNPASAGGTVKLADALTLGSTRQFGVSGGALDLNSQTLTTGKFNASSPNARSLAGPGTIVLLGSGSGTFGGLDSAPAATISGTPTINMAYSGGTATSIGTGPFTETGTLNFKFSAGTYALGFLINAGDTAKDVDFTGFAGTWNARTVATTIYGSLTLSSGMTFTASSGVLTFGATSGTQIITTNGKTVDEPLTVNGVGGTWQLADALAMGATRTLTLNNGTFDAANKTVSGMTAISSNLASGNITLKNLSTSVPYNIDGVGITVTLATNISVGVATLTSGTLNIAGYVLTAASFQTGIGTKNITFNGGTLTCTNATTTAFNNAQPTGFTTTAGTGTGKISMTAATAKTFVGGGSTYNCTLSNDGAGALTISGSNTFTTIANGVQPTAFTFTAATTQTVTDWNVSGTAGNLVTVISSTAGVPALLSKASGTVSSNYLSLKDSTATGGATWYAGANSTDVSGNSGWIFSNAPSNAAGSFFFMF
jgi:hypothetical protein